MKNTVIKYTGNSRYLRSVANFLTLYPTYEAFAQALITGTLPVDILGLNASGVQQAGDPLNKATLLKDATAAMYGLPATAVPDDVLAAIPNGLNSGWALLKDWKVAGTYTWTVPNLFGGRSYEIGVMIIGAGGGGAVSFSGRTYVSGGASGYSEYFTKIVSPGDVFNLVVGKGGAPIITSGKTSKNGNNGGSSSFSGITAEGGSGGVFASSNSGAISNGAMRSVGASAGTFGGANVSTKNALMCFNPFETKRILASGGGAQNDVNTLPGGKSPITGKGGGNGVFNATKSPVAGSADDTGCGGGSAVTTTNISGATSGAGADGSVGIYVRRYVQ